MTQTDPIIAVRDLAASSRWYQALLGCRSKHGGDHFDVLVNDEGEVLLCLHPWKDHDHPTMTDDTVPVGNGLILYFRTDRLAEARENAARLGVTIEAEIHLNPNSRQPEFSLRDPDGYYLTLTELHQYEG